MDTRVDEIGDGIFRLNTPVTIPGGAFSFNQYLIVDDDILPSSEAFRARMDYFSHTRNAAAMIERLAATAPTTLACMHGSAFEGDGAALLRSLGKALDHA